MIKKFKSRIRLSSPFFITCEHASRRIPREFSNLGLSRSDIKYAKDVDDPGAYDLYRHLADKLSTSKLHATISRAVIDINRKLTDHPKDIFHASALKRQLLTIRDGKEVLVDVPANEHNAYEVERERFHEIAVPYHDEAELIVGKLLREHAHVYVLPIHTYFREYNGQKRGTDIGILFRHRHLPEAQKFQKAVQDVFPDLHVDFNVPYDLSNSEKSMPTGMDHLESDQRITILIIEVSNDLLVKKKDITRMQKAVRVGIESLLQ